MDDKLRRLFGDLFGVPEMLYSERLTIDDVDNWDSVTHVTLILALEDAFGVRFSPDQASGLTSIQVIKDALAQHMSPAPGR